MARPRLLSFVALTAVASLSPPAPAAPPPTGFERLRALVGEWRATTERGGTVRAGYRLIAGDSALVQSFVTPSGNETMTVFHQDGAATLATHYCGQGNQPRLRLDAATSTDRFVFSFVDATNLARPAAARLVRLELRLEGPAQYTAVETYEEDGKPDVTTLRFQRVR